MTGLITPFPRALRHTLDEYILADLEERRLVTPPSGGYRKIFVKAYRRVSTSQNEKMTKFPVVAESVETLKMAGFTKEAAEEVFRRFTRVRETDEFGWLGRNAELDDVACRYIDGRAATCDASLPQDNYREAWKWQGMAASRYDLVLRPEYDIIRLRDSASAHFKRSVRAIAEYVFTLGKKIKAQHTKEEQRQAKAPATPTVEEEVDLPRAVKGCTMLYKGGNYDRLEKIFTDPEGSKVEFEELVSLPPTDFHRRKYDIFYATKQLEVAEMYCGFNIAVSGQEAGYCILHIALPNDVLERDDFRWISNPEWKDLIWASRGPRAHGSGLWRMPSDLVEFANGFGLAGNLCRTSSNGVCRLKKKEDVQDVRLSDGNKGTQYAFFEDAYPVLNSKCEGQVWLERRQITSEGKLAKSRGKGLVRAKRG